MVVIDPALFSLTVLQSCGVRVDHSSGRRDWSELPVGSLASESTESSAIFRMIEKILIVIDHFR